LRCDVLLNTEASPLKRAVLGILVWLAQIISLKQLDFRTATAPNFSIGGLTNSHKLSTILAKLHTNCDEESTGLILLKGKIGFGLKVSFSTY